MIHIDELKESLPAALAERTRLLSRERADSKGECVFYWMRTAIRAEENPVLDVAIHFANRLGLPLLVYQGLSERYPFASDRPNWARETLREHENDPRELLSWETMSRARTGDSIWDFAQRALLIHGELHNNVRMAWGKSVLEWALDAKQALARLVDLNHR